MAGVPKDNEIKAVLELTGIERYKYLVKKIADQQMLWSLWNEGWMTASDNNGRELIPVWPHHKYANLCADGEWAGSTPKEIDLEAWMDRWIHGAQRDKRLIAVFPTPDSKGVVVNPDKLKDDIDIELSNY